MRHPLRDAYCAQRLQARNRGIPFLLTFQQWLQIWIDSGHLQERGIGRDKYCMARFNDSGAYEIGNVHIITNGQNRAEQVLTDETRAKISETSKGRKPRLGQKDTEETKEKKRVAALGNQNALGNRWSHSEETKARMKGNQNATGSRWSHSEEAKAIISAKAKARHAARKAAKRPAGFLD